MIKITNIRELGNYFNIPREAIDFLASLTPDTENGKYVFSEDCFVNVQTVETKCERNAMEGHVRNVDVQFLIEGEERMYYVDKAGLEVKKPASPTGDTTIYFFDEKSETVTYVAGEAIIFYPEDAHLPNCAVDEPRVIKKAVAKINVATKK